MLQSRIQLTRIPRLAQQLLAKAGAGAENESMKIT
jgi:hypothetical protein